VRRVRAARIHEYGGPEVFRLEDVPRPDVGPRDLLIEVHASSVNPVDTKLRAGAQRLLVRYRLPWILGLDVSGVVVEVGAEVTRFRVGDEVFASPRHERPGCYAELVAVDEREVALKPARLSHLEAAAIPLAGLTAWDCLVGVTRVREGDSVLIHAGAGGVGTFAIQIAKHLGATVATTASAASAELVRGLGADAVVDYRRERFEEVLPPQDVVLDSLGWDSIERSLGLLKRGGRLVSIQAELPRRTARYGQALGAMMTGLAIAWLPLRARVRHGVRAHSLLVRAPDGENLARLAGLVEAERLRPVLDGVFPLEQIADAHRRSETGHAHGKIVVAVKTPPEGRPPAAQT
jgi:NADPH:quinone reductase-like Zn-dependent oxidoreductase